MIYSREFQEVCESVARLKVFGGWLIRTTGYSAVAICFYPDPNHDWKLC